MSRKYAQKFRFFNYTIYLRKELRLANTFVANTSDINLSGVSRINVVGTSGSGKSTFSKRLSEILKIPYVEIDKVYWGRNWYEPSDEEFFPKLEKAIDMDSWVLDGNYTRTIPIKWKNVQVIIWLDYPFAKTFFRVLKRAMYRLLTKKEIWEGTGNRETLRGTFLDKESILLWTIRTYNPHKKLYSRAMNDEKYAHIKFVRLSSSKETAEFLERIEKANH